MPTRKERNSGKGQCSTPGQKRAPAVQKSGTSTIAEAEQARVQAETARRAVLEANAKQGGTAPTKKQVFRIVRLKARKEKVQEEAKTGSGPMGDSAQGSEAEATGTKGNAKGKTHTAMRRALGPGTTARMQEWAALAREGGRTDQACSKKTRTLVELLRPYSGTVEKAVASSSPPWIALSTTSPNGQSYQIWTGNQLVDAGHFARALVSQRRTIRAVTITAKKPVK